MYFYESDFFFNKISAKVWPFFTSFKLFPQVLFAREQLSYFSSVSYSTPFHRFDLQSNYPKGKKYKRKKSNKKSLTWPCYNKNKKTYK